MTYTHLTHYTPKTEPDSLATQLRHYSDKGLEAYHRSDFETALSIWKEGLAQAGRWGCFDAKPSEEVMALVLRLYGNAGVAKEKLGDWNGELKYCEKGLAQAGRWGCFDAKPSEEVMEVVLKLYVNAGFAKGQLGEPNKALEEYYEKGLAQAGRWGCFDAKPSEEVMVTLLKLYSNAGFTKGQLGEPNKALEEYLEKGLAQAVRWGCFDAKPSKEVMELVLKLYSNAGVAENNLGHRSQAEEYYREGGSVAQGWLATGGTPTAEIKDILGLLHVNWAQSAAMMGGWAAQLQEQQIQEWKQKGNWDVLRQRLQAQLNRNSGFPKADMEDFQKAASAWLSWQSVAQIHLPVCRGRSQIEVVLGLAEGEYLLQQWSLDHAFGEAYLQLSNLQFPESVDECWQAQSPSLSACLDRLFTISAQLGDPLPKPLGSKLRVPPWYRRWRHPWMWKRLQQDWQTCCDLENALRNRPEWNRWARALEQTESSQVKLLATVLNPLVPEYSLIPPGHFLLAVLALHTPPTTWESTPPWQDPDSLRSSLDRTRWTDYTRGTVLNLGEWLEFLKAFTLNRKGVDFQLLGLCERLRAWQRWENAQRRGEAPALFSELESAWERAKVSAKALAQALSLLAQPTQCQALTPDTLKGVKDCAPHWEKALQSTLNGQIEDRLRGAIAAWLTAQDSGCENGYPDPFPSHLRARLSTGNLTHPLLPPAHARLRLQHRFNRLWQLHPHTFAVNAVNQAIAALNIWGPTWLQTVLQAPTPDLPQLFETLERGRLAFRNFSWDTQQQNAWQEQTGEQLHNAFTIFLNSLEQPQVPLDFPPLATWLTQLGRALPPRHSVTECQQRLNDSQALIQPVFDLQNSRLRVLWLDRQHFELKDFAPDLNTAPEAWQAYLPLPSQLSTLTAETSLFNHVASCLAAWCQAYDIRHLVAIFPAPLGQFPWESHPELGPILSRDITVDHWYNSQDPSPPTNPKSWVFTAGCLTSRSDNELLCSALEAQRVAAAWQVAPDCPSQPPGIWDFLHQLKQQQSRIYLSLHGQFKRNAPLHSGLHFENKLPNDAAVYLPIWVCQHLPVNCELILLSACETHAQGEQTNNILSPLGIAPTLVAAGARTVIGCLWEVNDSAALFFMHCLLTQWQAQPQLAWHQILNHSRNQLRDLSKNEVENLITGWKSKGWDLTEACRANIPKYSKPFSDPKHWAGWNMLGQNFAPILNPQQ